MEKTVKTEVIAAPSRLALLWLAPLVGCGEGVHERPGELQVPAAAELTSPEQTLCPLVRPVGPGVLSTPADEGRLVLTPDGHTAFFHRRDPRGRLTILESHRSEDGWTLPELVPFSGHHDDLDPFVSSDGSRLYFSSFRPTGGGPARPDADIWLVRRRGPTWEEPVHLGPEVNTPYHELYPSTTADGTLYFNSNRAAPDPSVWDGWDIYRSRLQQGARLPAEPLEGINTANFWEFNPSPSPDGRLLLFASLDRPDGQGGTDLYASVRWRGRWLPPHNLGSCINSDADEYHPTLLISRPGLLFVRAAAGGGDGDLFELGSGR